MAVDLYDLLDPPETGGTTIAQMFQLLELVYLLAGISVETAPYRTTTLRWRPTSTTLTFQAPTTTLRWRRSDDTLSTLID